MEMKSKEKGSIAWEAGSLLYEASERQDRWSFSKGAATRFQASRLRHPDYHPLCPGAWSAGFQDIVERVDAAQLSASFPTRRTTPQTTHRYERKVVQEGVQT